MNHFRLALFIAIVSLLYTTPHSPSGNAGSSGKRVSKEEEQQQQQIQQQQEMQAQINSVKRPKGPATGILPSGTDLYKQYESDTKKLGRSAEEIQEQNAEVFKKLHAYKPLVTPGRRDSVTFGQAKAVIDYTLTHPVVGMKELKKYDPEGCFGFCFGRAMFIHMELLARGVNKDSIRKAYVVGEMEYGGITWQFHVATTVKGADGSWYVIDPEFDKVETVEEWFAGNLELSPDKKLRLYMTDANKFGASAPAYSPNGIAGYNGYFSDAMKSFRERPTKQINKFIDHRLCQNVFN